MVNHALRARIAEVVTAALQPIPAVLAGWEGGSAAFGRVDAYSDIDLEYLVNDDVPLEDLYQIAERALATVSPIVARYTPTLGRYYRLQDTDAFLLVDLVFVRVGDAERHLEVERHGETVPLFDKGHWLDRAPLDETRVAAQRDRRFRELQTWFPMSQVFVRKALLRGQQVEAVNAYWACTLKPLAELLRMRYAPARWDFGVRYLDTDLPAEVSARFSPLALVQDLQDLDSKWAIATSWANDLLEALRADDATD